jgi:hypothetical protein
MTDPITPEPSTKAPPVRRRSGRRLFAAILVLIVSPFAAYGIWSRVEEWRLDRAFDAIEARGESLDVAAFEPHPSTPEQRQASHHYARAIELVGEDWTPFRTAARTVEELCALPPADAGREQRLAALRQLEERYAPALEQVDRATALDAAGWDDADRPRDFSRLLMRARLPGLMQLRVARLACTGDGEAAAAALIGTLRLRRVPATGLFSGPPPATAHGLQSLLTWTAPSTAILERLQHEYMAAADEGAVEAALLAGRAQWLSYLLPGELSDPPPWFLNQRIGLPEAWLMSLTRPLRTHAIVRELAEYDEAIAAAKQPWPSKLTAASAIGQKYQTSRNNTRSGWRFLASPYVASPFGAHDGPERLAGTVPFAAETLARTRASIVVLAIARYQRAHGALPGSVADLVPAYLAAPLVDPFTGEPLKYRHEGDKYKAYSVGFNRQDDGGTWDSPSDLQTGRRGYPLDVGIAVGAWPASR